MSAACPGTPLVPPPAAAARGARAWQGVLTAGLAGLGFFVPFSTAGTSLALAALCVLCLLAPRRILQLQPWREPALATGLLLFAFIALRTFLGEGWSAASAGTVNGYHELLMLPLLWALLRLAQRPQVLLYGLLAGALLLAGLHWLAEIQPWAAGFLFKRRISGGFALAVCAFLALEHARLGVLPRRAGLAVAGVLAATALFANDSRTAHLVLLLLAACAAWRAAPARLRLPAFLLAAAAVVALGALSQPLRERMDETLLALDASRQGRVDDSSSGARIELLHGSLAVARAHWLQGTGWQGYGAAFAQAAAARGMTDRADLGARSDNPHNEYLLQLSAGGIAALLLFLLWLGAALREGWRSDDPWAGALACVALAFAVGCLFNSLLLDFVEGHFHGVVLAMLLARRGTR